MAAEPGSVSSVTITGDFTNPQYVGNYIDCTGLTFTLTFQSATDGTVYGSSFVNGVGTHTISSPKGGTLGTATITANPSLFSIAGGQTVTFTVTTNTSQITATATKSVTVVSATSYISKITVGNTTYDLKDSNAYSLPSGGIPATDLASSVQTSLGKADTAYQKPSGGIPKTDLVSAVQTSLGKADSAYQKASTGIPESDLASAVTTKLNSGANKIFYGTCATAKATADKVATLTDDTGFSLTTGVCVAIKFTYASTAAPMTLEVNNTGAKTIVRYGTTQASSGTTTSGWIANSIGIFFYDGTYWVRDYWNNTTYSAMTVAEIEAGTSTTARLITPKLFVDTISEKEASSNKVTSISSSSTDTQYPSAKCVYDIVGDIESALTAILGS